jgi:hypothetical protein
VGDAKGIRQKITEMKMRLIKDALRGRPALRWYRVGGGGY